MTPPAPPPQDAAPNQWGVLADWCKTVITLASALLALTITFSGPIADKASASHLWWLRASWGLLLVAIVLGVISYAFVITYLRKGSREKASVLLANLAFLVLTLSSGAILVFGLLTIRSTGKDALATVETAIKSMPKLSGRTDTQWTVQALDWREPTKTFDLVVVDARSSERFLVTVDSERQKIIKFEKRP